MKMYVFIGTEKDAINRNFVSGKYFYERYTNMFKPVSLRENTILIDKRTNVVSWRYDDTFWNCNGKIVDITPHINDMIELGFIKLKDIETPMEAVEKIMNKKKKVGN